MPNMFCFTYLLVGFILVWRKMPRAIDYLYLINPNISTFKLLRITLAMVIIWPRLLAR